MITAEERVRGVLDKLDAWLATTHEDPHCQIVLTRESAKAVAAALAVSMDLEAEKLQHKLAQRIKLIDYLQRLLAGVGLEVRRPMGNQNAWVAYHRGARTCKCGRLPRIEEDILERGQWLVNCPECVLRTSEKARVADAIRAWNAGEYLEGCKVVQEPLRAESMMDSGALELVGELRKEIAREYLGGLRVGHPSARLEEDFPGLTHRIKKLWKAEEEERKERKSGKSLMTTSEELFKA